MDEKSEMPVSPPLWRDPKKECRLYRPFSISTSENAIEYPHRTQTSVTKATVAKTLDAALSTFFGRTSPP